MDLLIHRTARLVNGRDVLAGLSARLPMDFAGTMDVRVFLAAASLVMVSARSSMLVALATSTRARSRLTEGI